MHENFYPIKYEEKKVSSHLHHILEILRKFMVFNYISHWYMTWISTPKKYFPKKFPLSPPQFEFFLRREPSLDDME